MSKKKQKYYVVWNGRAPGIYYSWEECARQVVGFKGARYKAFDTIEEALDAFLKGPPPSGRKLHQTTKPVPKLPGLLENPQDSASKPIPDSIVVDAACSGNPGIMEYQGIYLRDGKRIFYFGPVTDATNNIGEFLAIVHALAWLKKQGKEWPVYSDSQTAIKWVLDKKANTTLQRTPGNTIVFDLIQRAEQWLQSNQWNNPLLKWDTALWGEIPADFGRKK